MWVVDLEIGIQLEAGCMREPNCIHYTSSYIDLDYIA